MNRIAVHARISGRVQGVWFRGWTVETARGLGLDGWVRNRRDGTVEALFCGAPPVVDRMLDEVRRGPPAARVVAVDTTEAAAPLEPGFQTLPTI